MSSPRHRRRKKAQREALRHAYLDSVKQNEEWGALSPHEKYLAVRGRENWKHIPDLPLASIFQDTETTKTLIAAGVDIESCATDGMTALMHSAIRGDLDAVRILLEAGADANKQASQGGATSLTYASSTGHTETVKLLLDSGADPQTKDHSGRTFLHAAVGGGVLDIVHFALSAGIDINAKSADGLTPLHVAAWSRNPRLLHLLIEHGADVNAKTTWGLTALIAVTTDDESFRPAHAECTALLVEHGADVNAQDNEGSTPLMGAAFYGDIEVVKYLRQHGAKLDIVDGRGRTALVKASEKLDIASFLASEECGSS